MPIDNTVIINAIISGLTLIGAALIPSLFARRKNTAEFASTLQDMLDRETENNNQHRIELLRVREQLEKVTTELETVKAELKSVRESRMIRVTLDLDLMKGHVTGVRMSQLPVVEG